MPPLATLQAGKLASNSGPVQTESGRRLCVKRQQSFAGKLEHCSPAGGKKGASKKPYFISFPRPPLSCRRLAAAA